MTASPEYQKAPHSQTGWRVQPGTLSCPLIIAHRGDSGSAPENTLAAFRRAVAAGADGAELDVRLTRDGKLTVFHDRSLDRTSNSTGLVSRHTLAEIQRLDVGSWFGPDFKGEIPPTLDEVFEQIPPGFLLVVELKAPAWGVRLIAQRVVEAVQRHQRWDSTMVASFNPLSLLHLRQMEPRIARAYNWSKRHPYPLRARWLSWMANPHWFSPAEDTYSPQLQERFRKQGKPMLAWDIDFDCDLAAMAAAGLDGVVVNSPAALVQQKVDLRYTRDSC